MSVLHRLPAVLLAILIAPMFVQSQSLFQISQDEKFTASSLIVEGRVTGQKSYWNPQHTMIFTSNEVEVYKVFKGTTVKKTIEVVTTGGAVASEVIQASDLLQFDKNDVGIFYCRPNASASILTRQTTYDIYSSLQGFLKYDLKRKTAAAPFVQYDDIERQLYQELYKKAGRTAEIKNQLFSVEEASKALSPASGLRSTLAPVITSFSPASVTAGTLLDPTNNILTINGSGFENNPDSLLNVVSFPHTDKQAGNFYDVSSFSDLIISWTDTQIKLHVPTSAGTGTFQVRTSTGSVSSPRPIDVTYSILSGFIPDINKTVQFNLANENKAGGYTFKYSTSTANSGLNINTSNAKATVQRAIGTWKELTGVNITEAGTTINQKIDPYDGENIVTFDNGGTTLGGPLPAGVLATCYSGFSACNLSKPFFKSGFDVVIRNANYSTGSIAFTFGPCSPYSTSTPQVDLETVLLHELGHALNLGHIIDGNQGSGAGNINPAKLMNFSVSYNLRRITPDRSAMAGAQYAITPHGLDFGTCLVANADMVPLPVTRESKDECPASFPTSVTPLQSTVSFDLAHSTSNELVDPGFGQFFKDGTTTSITNTAYYPIRTNTNGGDLSLQVENYSTQPGQIAACVPAGTVAVSGVELSLYKVSACPVGGSYPTPAATVVFAGNGIVPTITGLAGNSNYLLVLDGVENTKASFNLMFSGSALSARFTDFTGAVEPDLDRLAWTMDMSEDVDTMLLERSSDGINFKEIYKVPAASRASGDYADYTFVPGDNYYRLAVHNNDGSVQYSQIVILTRTESLIVHIYPNPVVTQSLNVEILTQTPGNFYVSLTNVRGQKVVNKKVAVVSNDHNEKVSLSGVAPGIYFLNVLSEDGKKVKALTLVVAK